MSFVARFEIPAMSSLEAMALAQAATGPEWYRDVVWQVAAGLMTGDEAVALVIGEHRRLYPEIFEDGYSPPASASG